MKLLSLPLVLQDMHLCIATLLVQIMHMLKYPYAPYIHGTSIPHLHQQRYLSPQCARYLPPYSLEKVLATAPARYHYSTPTRRSPHIPLLYSATVVLPKHLLSPTQVDSYLLNIPKYGIHLLFEPAQFQILHLIKNNSLIRLHNSPVRPLARNKSTSAL